MARIWLGKVKVSEAERLAKLMWHQAKWEDLLPFAEALVRGREALEHIARETEGVPEQNCEIAYGTATAALAAYSALLKEE